uniref:Uncharacterized protein MANES_06G060800 n=1 Tax=Rhizophora mucronata TaxID=61149 RepID=A0A2P2IJ04_RHIMU
METLCFCPPLMLTPLSPISVRSWPGSKSRSCCNAVTSITFQYCWGSYVEPNNILSRTLALKIQET